MRHRPAPDLLVVTRGEDRCYGIEARLCQKRGARGLAGLGPADGTWLPSYVPVGVPPIPATTKDMEGSPRRTPRNNFGAPMNLHLTIAPLIALIAGVLILVMPRLLNYIVALYLIIIGILGLFPGAGIH
jgi:hypothetical protein